LTNGVWSGILTKLSARWTPRRRESGGDSGHIEPLRRKTSKKVLDKAKTVW